MDTWEFKGSLGNQYKQIGNAVPVNLAYAIGRSLVRLLNQLIVPQKTNKIEDSLPLDLDVVPFKMLE